MSTILSAVAVRTPTSLPVPESIAMHPHPILRAAAAALAVTIAATARAQMPLPRVDYSAVLRVSGAPGPVRVAHHAGVVRSEGQVGGRAVVGLLELASGRVTLMPAGGGPALQLPPGTPVPGLADFDLRAYTLGPATGQGRVAGHPCTLRRVDERGQAIGTACVHAQDIVLSFDGRVRGHAVQMETLSLSIAAQSPAAFAVPSGAGSIGDWLERLPAIPGLTAPRHPAP